jgi:hypothetical protein
MTARSSRLGQWADGFIDGVPPTDRALIRAAPTYFDKGMEAPGTAQFSSAARCGLMLSTLKKNPAWIGGAKETRSLSPDFDINARATVSFSQLNTWLAAPVALLNCDFIITPVTTDCHVGFPHAIFRAGGSNASFVANLHSARGRGKYRRTRKGGC